MTISRSIASPTARPLSSPLAGGGGGGLPPLPAGQAFLVDDSGNYLIDDSNNYLTGDE